MLEFIEEALDEITLAIEAFVERWQVDPVRHEFDVGACAAFCEVQPQGIGVIGAIGQRMRGNPSIVSILMRSGTVGSEAQRRVVREQADYLIEPPMPTIGLRDWKKFDQAIKEGYETACAAIEKNGVPLTNVWSDGPALAVPKSLASAS